MCFVLTAIIPISWGDLTARDRLDFAEHGDARDALMLAPFIDGTDRDFEQRRKLPRGEVACRQILVQRHDSKVARAEKKSIRNLLH